MPRGPKKRKTIAPRLAKNLRADLSHEVFAALYPDLPRRIREIWNSDIPFVSSKVSALQKAFQERGDAHRRNLCNRFGLTATEARIAVHIFEGGSVASFAATAGCATSTVRKHLKSIFRKTGIARQSELAALLVPTSLERLD
jgi:DNA-binding CsgD family transcriptional regulator